ncbi:MAG: prephenate dehydrogenase/arogenate dehydrogenase family protein [Nitrospirae bacterium]|nr:prephenate dehydrogenase/arogenate dehydrogenase family protein [Nitrospirota bacterium]
MHFNKLTIVGVGLIGASFALAMRKYKLCDFITGNGRSIENLKKAKEMRIIDSFELDPQKACDGSDLILFATPVGSFLEIVRKIQGSLKKGCILTDVGSVKGRLVNEMEALMPEGVYFIGGHPIAGSNRSGIETARAEIFIEAKCIITPTERTSKDALDKIIYIWKTFGSIVELIDPEEHDRIYAAVSHLPHLIAYAIVNTIGDLDSSYLRFAGQGFMGTTRIASSSPELWRDICILNKDNLLSTIDIFRSNLDRLGKYIKDLDSRSLEKEFNKARRLREGIGQN